MAVQWAMEREQMPIKSDSTHFKGGLITCEAGMGKTRIALSICARDPTMVTLVLCPAGVIDDWLNETTNVFGASGLVIKPLHKEHPAFKPKMSKYSYPNIILRLAFDQWIGEGTNVFVTTPQTFVDSSLNPEQIERISRVIIDESHQWSNPAGKRYKKFQSIIQPIPFRWGLTGTPFRNVRDDVVAQLSLLDDYGRVNRENTDTELMRHMFRLEYGPQTIQLPPRQVHIIETDMTALEYDLYRHIYMHTKDIEFRGSRNRNITVKGAMTYMRQAAISMNLIPLGLVQEMRGESKKDDSSNAPSAIGSMFRGAINIVSRWANFTVPFEEPPSLGDRHLDNYVSSKFRAVLDKIIQITTEFPDDKMLVFSSFSGALELLETLIMNHVKPEWEFALYMGKTLLKQRAAMRRRFMTDPTFKALLITYEAGGAGLNLQRATHVLEIDPCFTDALLKQSEARCWRIGQTRVVQFYRFIANKTYEKRMEYIRSRKAEAWNNMADEADENGAEGAMDMGTIKEILDAEE
jgi:SNF2 family DNA or RNA helicase